VRLLHGLELRPGELLLIAGSVVLFAAVTLGYLI
jgi:hypothetical protein